MINILVQSSKDIAKAIRDNRDLRELDDSLNIYVTELQGELSHLQEVSRAFEPKNKANIGDVQDLMASVQALQATAALFESAANAQVIQADRVSVARAARWVSTKLIPWLKNMWSSVWAVIMKVLTPKEWKLKGGIGSGVFGLVSAEIEITFG